MSKRKPTIPDPWEWYSDKVQWMAMNGPPGEVPTRSLPIWTMDCGKTIAGER
jgi:hypothetical protein